MCKFIETVGITNCPGVLHITINIDGVPLFSSSVSGFWTIIGSIKYFKQSEFVIGIYYGQQKPSSSNDFLNDLVLELKEMEANPIEDTKQVVAKLDYISCDTPARVFVKNIKSYTGYNGCDRCTVRGKYFRSVSFVKSPNEIVQLRTDESFRSRKDAAHHHPEKSAFEDLKDIDMIHSFPNDMMHSVCKGVSLKLLELLRSGPLQYRVNSLIMDTILMKLRPYIPADFARKPRSIKHLHLWKATEMRLFTVYLIPVVLPKLLENANGPLLEIFLAYFVVIFMMCNPILYFRVEDKIRSFIEERVIPLLGEDFMSYNVHSLLHLATDYQRLGPIDEFSNFKFENFLRFLKKFVRTPNQPLQQVVRRILESDQFLGRLTRDVFDSFEPYPAMPQNCDNKIQYRKMNFDGTFLQSDSKNCFFLCKNLNVLKFLIFYKKKINMWLWEENFFIKKTRFSGHVSPHNSKSLLLKSWIDFSP